MSYRFVDSFRAGPVWNILVLLESCMTYTTAECTVNKLPMMDSFWAGWKSVLAWSCSKAVYKPVWYIPLLSVQWINSWWWTEGLSETCRFSCQNKFVKLVHLVGFIIKKFVTMHGQMNVKLKKCVRLIAFIIQEHSLNFPILQSW